MNKPATLEKVVANDMQSGRMGEQQRKALRQPRDDVAEKEGFEPSRRF